jgi:PAS domain S-box-containing protein
MKENLVRRVVGLFLLMLAVLVYVAVSSVRNIEQDIKGEDWVNHTHAVIMDADDTLSYLHAGDSALRTFLITGDKRDQAAYRVAYNTMVEKWDDVKALSRSYAEEKPLHDRILDLEPVITNRIDVARSIVRSFEQGGLAGVRTLFAANPDVESITKIERSINNLIIGYEEKLLQERDVQEHLQAQATRMTVFTGVAVNFVLLSIVLWLLMDDLAARRKAAQALEEANAQLEGKVQERTADLVKANQTLKQENLERRWSYQALDHQLRYNQLIINSIAELVFVISRALNISRVNPAVVHQTNWEPQDLIAQSIERVLQFPPDPASAQNPLITAMRDGREIQERPATLLSRAGRSIPVHFSLIPLHDQDKVVGGVVTVRLQNGTRPAAI